MNVFNVDFDVMFGIAFSVSAIAGYVKLQSHVKYLDTRLSKLEHQHEVLDRKIIAELGYIRESLARLEGSKHK